MFQMYKAGCMVRQPDIQPGSQYFDPTTTSVLSDMAFPDPAGIAAMGAVTGPT